MACDKWSALYKVKKINSQSRTDVKLSESKYQKLKYRKQRRYGQLPLFCLVTLVMSAMMLLEMNEETWMKRRWKQSPNRLSWYQCSQMTTAFPLPSLVGICGPPSSRLSIQSRAASITTAHIFWGSFLLLDTKLPLRLQQTPLWRHPAAERSTPCTWQHQSAWPRRCPAGGW